MSALIRFSFPLGPRMEAFLQLRNALACLFEAEHENRPLAWLQAGADVRLSLSGEQGRRPALPEVMGLLVTMQAHLEQLAEDHPRFRERIMDSCARLERHAAALRDEQDAARQWLESDALIEAWLNALKKHDWLGHKRSLPSALPALWQNATRREETARRLAPLAEAVESLHAMLHDYVAWESRVAREGSDQLMPDRGQRFGLVIVGLSESQVSAGLAPDISGNRLAIRIRFQRWSPGQASEPVLEDVLYHAMLVPVA
jgi:hypothetical protein